MIYRFLRGYRITAAFAVLWISGILALTLGFVLMDEKWYMESLIVATICVGWELLNLADEEPIE